MSTTQQRPLLVGDPSGPSPPYPLRMSGPVIAGFGRGSKELGIPTANIPVDTPDAAAAARARTTSDEWLSSTPSGVYFGYASLRLPEAHPDYHHHHHSAGADADATTTSTKSTPTTKKKSRWQVYPMVMSIGYNPFYKNTVRSAEVHILHKFSADFYGSRMRLLIMGYIREEKDYEGLDALIRDIEFDCEVARASLSREGWKVESVLAGGKDDGSWLVGDEDEDEDEEEEEETDKKKEEKL